MKKIFAGFLGSLLLAALIIGVFAVILLVDAGLLHLLGARYASFGWLAGYVLLAAVIGLPLELVSHGLPRALFHLGWASRKMANFLYVPLDALCSATFLWTPCAPPSLFGRRTC